MRTILCIAVLLLAATPAAAAPTVAPKRVQDRLVGDLGVNIDVRGVYCRAPFSDSPTAVPGPVEVRLRYRRRRDVLTVDPCADWYEWAKGMGWRARSWVDRWPQLRVRVAAGRSRVYRFRYAVLVADRLVESGGLRLRTVRHPEHRIWEGTDEFVNVCINGGHRLWSDSGRLYCYISAWTSVAVRVSPRRRPAWREAG